MCFKAESDLKAKYTFTEGDYLISIMMEKTPKVLSSKIIRLVDHKGVFRLAVPKKMTLCKSISDSDPLPLLERFTDEIDFEAFPSQYWFRVHKQDQLQDFFQLRSQELLRVFYKYLDKFVCDTSNQSMEKLWLRCLMYKKFNKIWCDNCWTIFKQ